MPGPSPTTAIYIRTSTHHQDGLAQGHVLDRAAPDAVWFIDVGESGSKARRPMLDELRAAVRRGEVDEVVSTALDRLGRSSLDVVMLVDELAAAGVRIRTIREGVLDPASPISRFTLQLFAALAEMERALIRERVRAGVKRAQDEGTRSGKPIGRPRRAVDATEVRRRREAGESWRTIAQALRCPTATIRRAAVSKPTPGNDDGRP